MRITFRLANLLAGNNASHFQVALIPTLSRSFTAVLLSDDRLR